MTNSSAATVNLTGHWEATWSNYDGGPHFNIDLTQTGNNLVGYHLANIDGGPGAPGHTDYAYAKDGIPSIKGTVVGNVATIQFHSKYSPAGEWGEATLTLNADGKLHWLITKKPSTSYLPNDELMVQKK